MKQLSEKVIKRLTLYHFILSEYQQSGLEYISSPKIADLLNIDNSQVRKDIRLVDHIGKCKIGYEVNSLKTSIETFLGFPSHKKAFIVGAGNLGTALVKYEDLKDYGLDVVAFFDNNPLKIGMKLNSKEVYNINELPAFIKKTNVKIAILAVPKEVAQDCAVFLAKAGIKYIWNFTPRVLKVDKSVKIWNENLIGNFLQFVSEEKKHSET